MKSSVYLTGHEIASLQVWETRGVNLFDGEPRFACGQKNYESLKKELLKPTQGKDITRAFHAIYDRNVLMLLTLNFLYSNEMLRKYECISNYQNNVLNISLLMRNLYQKYIFSRNRSLLDRIVKTIDTLQKNEQLTLEELLFELE